MESLVKVLVSIKRVIDPYVKVRVNPERTGVEKQSVKMSINPFDEIALEAAIRLREQGQAQEVIVVSIGDITSQETLRHALALGADRAILVSTDQAFCSLNNAKILKVVVEQEKPSLILMGKQSIDGDNNQTPQMLAALLNWPQATFASKLVVNDSQIEVTREIDGGLETVRLTLPAVVSVDLRLNTPRYPSLPNIMQAKRKPLTIQPLQEMHLKLKEHRQILAVNPPAQRGSGIMVDSVETLIAKLRQEDKVL